MKIVSIVGARPQFIKAAPVSKALRNRDHTELLVHTGQHYDYKMSEIFFKEMGISEPDINLEVASGTHGFQTGQMLMKIEKVLLSEKPDWVLVYGDTNSTLAGALAAVKLHIAVSHVESGLRSFNREMPEEHNRIITDHCSDILFCPTETAVDNLKKEGFTNIANNGKLIESIDFLSPAPLPFIINVGDTMYDAVLQFSEIGEKKSSILSDLNLEPKKYLLATVHRPYNTDIPEKLNSILQAFYEIDDTIVFPVHPRTQKCLDSLKSKTDNPNLHIIDPIGYLDMLMLEKNARVILTDSGGMQKEACFFGVPCVTLRPETEWIETVESGWNTVVGTNPNLIKKAAEEAHSGRDIRNVYGNGKASNKIVEILTMLTS